MANVNMAGEVSSTFDKSNGRDIENDHTSETLSHSSRGTARHYLEVENLNEIPLWLTSCNSIAALFQMMQAVFLIGLSRKVEIHWLIYTNFPFADSEEAEDTPVYARPDPTEIASYPLTYVSGAFIMVSAIDHILCTLPRFRENYEYNIRRHQNPNRWVEYSLSCSIMKVLIAQLAGVTDLHILICIFFLSHSVPCFAILHEKMNAKARADGYEQTWLPFYLANVPYLAAICVIISYVIAGWSASDPPAYSATIIVTLLIDVLFIMVFVLQWKKIGIFESYVIGELAFIILSFTAKTTLAWSSLGAALAFQAS